MKKSLIITAALLLAACGICNAQGYTTLGVGITSPNGTLHVHDNETHFYGPGPEPPESPRLDPTDLQYSHSTFHLTNYFSGTSLNDGFVIESYNYETTLSHKETGDLKIKNNSVELVLTSSGKVGIGATNNSYKFNVDGTMRVSSSLTCGGDFIGSGNGVFSGTLTVGNGFSCTAAGALKVKSLRVTTTDWPDYVFGGGHRLMPLQEVEDYIEAHGHLPEVPSAEEAEADGVDLGEMNKLLLQKVEELTLYIIDLQKQVEELKSNK